jgi:hypothetical protein
MATLQQIESKLKRIEIKNKDEQYSYIFVNSISNYDMKIELTIPYLYKCFVKLTKILNNELYDYFIDNILIIDNELNCFYVTTIEKLIEILPTLSLEIESAKSY